MRPLLLLLSVVLFGCASPIVGSFCREGFSPCESSCVDLERDNANCGACGSVCEMQETCMLGMCISADGSMPDGSMPDGSMPDGGMPGCGIGEFLCGTECVRLDVDPRHCGMCDNACAAGEFCSMGVCQLECIAPLVACGSACVDLQTDPDHCGSCGNACASGLCVAGACNIATFSHLVAIGHDYQVSRPGIRRIAGNSVFSLNLVNPVRVLVFEGSALPASIAGTDSAINEVATASGRTWSRTPATSAEVPLNLASADVFLVYAQPTVDADALATIGGTWSVALSEFLNRGGVIVFFEGEDTKSFRLFETLGHFPATATTSITSSTVNVTSPGDAIMIGVPSSYLAESTSARFEGVGTTGVVVSDGTPGAGVVVHQTVIPTPAPTP